MIVEFQSIIKRDGHEDEMIKFTAPIKIIQKDNISSWEFKEPSRGIMNLIEVQEDMVNIFAGAQTIMLKLKNKIQNNYQQPGMPMPIIFDSFLNGIQIEKNDLEIKYTLWQNKNIIGDYHMTLKIK